MGQARGGQEALKYVAFREGQLPGCDNPADAMKLLEEVKRKAAVLAHYDDQINSATTDRIRAMRELAELKSEAETQRDAQHNRAPCRALIVL